jgi:preprotein translocase subunit SecA
MGDDHIEHKMLSRGIENAQKRIESRNFDIRKNLLEYDDVANDQRQAIYSLRNQLLNEDNISEAINELINEEMHAVSHDFVPLDSVESQWRLEELDKFLLDHYFIQENISTKVKNDQKLTPVTIASLIAESAVKKYKEKYLKIGENLAQLEKQVMLQILESSEPEQFSKVETIKMDEPKLKRNEIVKITNGIEIKELKYKKAVPLIETGEWRII